MDESARQEALKQIQEKTRLRIKAGRDPRFVQWQGTLEALLFKIQHLLVSGEVITFESLKPEEIKQFHKLQIFMDLSPFVTAVFLPGGIARRLSHSVRSAEQVPEDTQKVVVTRLDTYDRILMAELSPTKPGIDIFEDGSLLGSYNYNTAEECLSDLSKIIWLHLKPPAWITGDYVKYTEGWFFRSASNKLMDLPINQNHSYIHHPVLLNIGVVQAIFRLTKATLLRLCGNLDNAIAMANAENLRKSEAVEVDRVELIKGNERQKTVIRAWLENRMLELLKLLRSYDAVNFKGFSPAEQKEFKVMFARVVDEVFQELVDDA